MATPIPQNLAPFTLDELARATGGRVLRAGPAVRGVSTDSRTIAPGAAFVALSGERFDGHRFLDAAAQRGAAAFVVSREGALPPAGGAVLVEDGLAALGALARAHRDRWRAAAHPGGPRAIVAIGGSAGKTTTTRAVAALLAGAGRGDVHATTGNLNNAVGLPMTLLGLEDRHRFAVVEIGTNQRGEVASLARIAGPDLAVLTSIGVEHTEGLGTLEDVAAEEGDLYAALPPGGVALGNGDDAMVVEQLARAGRARRITYGFGERADVRIAGRRPAGVRGSSARIERGGEALELVVPLLGEAGALAVAAAIAVTDAALGERLPAERAARAVAGLDPPGDGRLSVLELPSGAVVIDDSYNANPLSMRSSLKTAVEMAGALRRRLVLLLGEMRELGALAAAEHDALGEQVGAARPAALIAVGGEAARIARAAEAAGARAWFADDADTAAARALEIVEGGDLVLVKGSRGLRMERIVDALARRGAGSARPPST
ncbi:UDP-N-acetylmuramoylalanyl-D-glutamyl-2, 6-diaminopimelate--D-alanyl-D-alanine ligase [Sorangium cellulosum]|uniref:UDP-N-acetylmuramoyl-tripeptide--D-alanyl-D-alanine ligase n=1 Tax=Sorangium cellulosum TaxID=56 RepID=A0A4P2Q981_SORCE|nr:UDP-N-acetylmuramoyl-tripeptide--D-alanyl-D-alanine ligase [Sorangium cellulosum]AUX26079.1 UDP-N-acetylmuramoylalanyl-D-glutamyl-2, 6-diaminopimelate--D-alanyl-D-alanine ligase [Sorangium cellulosum]